MRKNLMITLVLVLTLSHITYAEADLITAKFNDLTDTHWGFDFIKWGLEKDIIGGYGDGRFAPNNQVTEAEFAAILARFSDNLPEKFDTITGKPWSEPFYNELLKYELPFRGYSNTTIRNAAVTRGQVAMIIAGKYGFNLTEKQAVYFMYENGLSNGKSATEKTFESYGAREPMTRTQALAFLMNMSNLEDKQMTFKGEKSIRGAADAEFMLGVVGVNVNNKILVDFADFNKTEPTKPALTEVDKITTITTKVEGSKVVAVLGQKITQPTVIEGVKNPSLNYYTIVSGNNPTVLATPLENSVVNYTGVDLPFNRNFRTPEGMIKYNDKVVGIVQIALDETYSRSIGSFKDKTAFISLMSNLKQLGATQAQLDKVTPIINQWQDGASSNDLKFLEITSKTKNTSLLVTYGRGGVIIGLYSQPMNWQDFRVYVD